MWSRKNCGEDIIVDKFSVIFDGCLVVLEVGDNGFWNIAPFFEDWIEKLCIEEDEARVTCGIPVIIRNVRTLNNVTQRSESRKATAYLVKITTSMETNKFQTITISFHNET